MFKVIQTPEGDLFFFFLLLDLKILEVIYPADDTVGIPEVP